MALFPLFGVYDGVISLEVDLEPYCDFGKPGNAVFCLWRSFLTGCSSLWPAMRFQKALLSWVGASEKPLSASGLGGTGIGGWG